MTTTAVDTNADRFVSSCEKLRWGILLLGSPGPPVSDSVTGSVRTVLKSL
jgi:hypothetical protein